MKLTTFLIISLMFLFLFFILGISYGAVKIPMSTVISILIFKITSIGKITEEILKRYETIIFNIRMPRVLLSILVGGALAGAGAVFQGIFRNNMADPYLIGLSSGAALGATIAISFQIITSKLGFLVVPVFAFAGSILTLLLVYKLAVRNGKISVTSLLLSGIAVSLTLSAVTSFLMVTSGKNLHSIIFWLMGGFTTASWIQVIVISPFIAVGLGTTLFYIREMNLLVLGEEKAAQLGVEVEKVKRILLISSSVAVAGAVSVSGLIGFVGLVVPHLIRVMGGANYKILLPCSIITGSSLLMLADTISRVALAPIEIPVGIVTSLIGGPFFLYLLNRSKKESY